MAEVSKPALSEDSIETGELRIVIGFGSEGDTFVYNYDAEGMSTAELVYVIERIKLDILLNTMPDSTEEEEDN